MNIKTDPSAKASATVLFAQSELKSYLSRMGCPDLSITLGVADLTGYGMPKVENIALDDQYLIEVAGDDGMILGGNERSVLLGVYHYLTLIGCAFLRPGKQFEVVPTKTKLTDYSAKAQRTASLRHRGVCIEGSNSVDNILDFIDWLPKVGYNSFFLQFEYPQTFLERFYDTDANPLRPVFPWTMEDSRRAFGAFDEAQQLRGIMQHRMGHGWTSRALNCTATGWDTEEKEFTEQERLRIAMVNGKRELWYGVPSNTNLCMSNPDAVEAYADGVVKYVKENPATAYLHLWLADGTNNHCECEKCRGMRPSDHYIDVLNRVDEKLTEIGSDVKLVMLLYVDLLWAPKTQRLKNPDRFVLMFAPITRTFEKSFDQVTPVEKEPEFNLNHLKFPKELEYYLRYLKDWQEATKGCDCFDYDYYLARAEMADPTHVNLSKVMTRDFKLHKELGMNGISSCQNLRNHMPNGFSGYVMGQITSDTSLSFEKMAEDYYTACYGADGMKLFALMEQLSDCFKQDFVNHAKPDTVEGYADMLAKVPGLLDKVTALVDEHVPCLYEAQEKMWTEVRLFVEYTRIFAECCALRAEGKRAEAVAKYDAELHPLACRYDMVDQSALDIWRMKQVLRHGLEI